jgi:hypothetical protein
LEVGHVPLKSPTRQLLAHDHFPMSIHSDEVKATLAEIHSDRSNTVIVCSDVSHSCSFSRISCASAAFPFTRLERAKRSGTSEVDLPSQERLRRQPLAAEVR